jgi:hypothetical protein
MHITIAFLVHAVRMKMQSEEETAFESFVVAFAEHYRDELKYAGLVPEEELLALFWEFKGSGKTPEQWFQQQELS